MEQIGQGRSAKVYLALSKDGKQLAQKIFTGEGLSKLILFILTGSANPYTWCASAMETAHARRTILAILCKYWFGDKLRLPKTDSWGWNDELKAYELKAELIDGSHAPLLNPLEEEGDSHYSELINTVMKPLQSYLRDSGFDGLVWQAGKGNPVAPPNFMLERSDGKTRRWVWIDLESGLPALFAINPLATLFYYLPKSYKHGAWLFDHVDVDRLAVYLKENRDGIIAATSKKDYQLIEKYFTVLCAEQKKWHSIKRFQRTIQYHRSQNVISEEQASYYWSRPLRWKMKNIVLLIGLIRNKVIKLSRSIYSKLASFNYRRLFRRIFRYAFSTRFRWGVARWYLARRIRRWVSRKQLSAEIGKALKSQLKADEISAFLTDFSVHIAIKPFVKLFTLLVITVLLSNGLISVGGAGLIAISSGSIARTIYTGWRMLHSLQKKNAHRPWLALLIGVIPVFGNLAFPIELVYRSTAKDQLLGKFIVYDILTQVGAKIPIWGGEDSSFEHFTNRWCNYGMRFLQRR